jgi:hypothetical protein
VPPGPHAGAQPSPAAGPRTVPLRPTESPHMLAQTAGQIRQNRPGLPTNRTNCTNKPTFASSPFVSFLRFVGKIQSFLISGLPHLTFGPGPLVLGPTFPISLAMKGSVPHNRIFALCFLAGGAIFAGQPIVPGFTHLAGTLQLNHGWTRINTDKNRGKSRSNPCLIEHRLVRRFFRPWNFSASVSICAHPWLRSVSTAWLRLRKSRLFPLTAQRAGERGNRTTNPP